MDVRRLSLAMGVLLFAALTHADSLDSKKFSLDRRYS